MIAAPARVIEIYRRPPPPVGLYANSHPQTRDSSKIRRSQNDCDSAVVQMSLGRDYRIAAVGRPVVWP